MSAYGIDLGTTNSVISHMQAGHPLAIAIEGNPIVPSVVLYRDNKTVVGRQAHNLALLYPEHTVSSVKRHMGRQTPVMVAGAAKRPEEVSADILKYLKRGAELATGQKVLDVVITVPAYFDDAQRRATLEAAALAELNVLRLINEPTAASLVYDQVAGNDDAQHTVLVFDLGGGTFDVSVLEVIGDIREVKATSGDTQLGGDDFDRLLQNLLRKEIDAAHGVDLRQDAVVMARLRRFAEDAKIALSSALTTRVQGDFLVPGGRLVEINRELKRSEFEDLIRPHLERCVTMAFDAVKAAGLQPHEIDRICLVGGSTRIPLALQLLSDAFDAPVHEEIDVDLAVSLGAAVQAAVLDGQPVERILVDVTAHDLGMLVAEDTWDREPDKFVAIIGRNTVLPAKRSREFYTLVDQQTQLQVDVFQGNRPLCSLNRKIGDFLFDLVKAPSNTPIQVQFEYDLNGIVRVTVGQASAGTQKTVAMRLADAAQSVEPVEAQLPNAVLMRKINAMTDRLHGASLQKLRDLVDKMETLIGKPRQTVEDELLDFLADVEDNEDIAVP